MHAEAIVTETYIRSAAVEVEDVLVERVRVQLRLDHVFRGRVGDADALLQALKHALAVLVRVLKSSSTSDILLPP